MPLGNIDFPDEADESLLLLRVFACVWELTLKPFSEMSSKENRKKEKSHLKPVVPGTGLSTLCAYSCNNGLITLTEKDLPVCKSRHMGLPERLHFHSG